MNLAHADGRTGDRLNGGFSYERAFIATVVRTSELLIVLSFRFRRISRSVWIRGCIGLIRRLKKVNFFYRKY
jgi:hypothetical protein